MFLKEFINLNVNNKHEKENRTCKIKQKYYDTFLEYTNFEDDLTEFNVYLGTKTINRSFMES